MMSSATGYSEWCRMTFDSMAEGGVWAVPRSGLIFTRRGDELFLTDRMPWSDDLAQAVRDGLDVPKDESVLRAYQDADYELIRQHFEAAGITVTNDLEGE